MDGEQAITKPRCLGPRRSRRGIVAAITAAALLPGLTIAADPPPTFHAQEDSRPICSDGLSKVRITRPKTDCKKSILSGNDTILRTTSVQLMQRIEQTTKTSDTESTSAEPNNIVPSFHSRP
ncbi:MAG: hypothetical protein GY904_35455 [Planctomycetaceae bacterium]|nr:hypothetical protein [Planctomycetaceae bacterium]